MYYFFYVQRRKCKEEHNCDGYMSNDPFDVTISKVNLDKSKSKGELEVETFGWTCPTEKELESIAFDSDV